MHTLRLKQSKSAPVKYLRARCGVRYWEDGEVNGAEDTDGSRIPLREGTSADNDHLGGGNWCPTIDLDTGKIENWPEGTTARVHYKCCDDGDYELLDADRNVVKAIEGYVPKIMCPEEGGFGDYVIMEISADGTIAKWKADLKEFERETGN
jgi:hypothetical protein